MTPEKSDQQEQAFGDLLNYLRQERGFDLTGYKIAPLEADSRLTYNPLRGHERDIQGVIILIEETEP